MKLKYEVVIENVAGQMIAVPVDSSQGFGGFFMKINSTGAYILKLLKNEICLEEILDSIQKDFEVDNLDDVKKAIIAFTDSLKKAEMLE